MPKCQYKLKAVKPPVRTITLRPYPHFPITLGNFLRKKRLDSGLLQKQVAELLKVSVENIRNWEANRGKVSLQFLPKVYDFIGFCPCDVSLSIGLRLKERREYFGLTIKKLSEILNVDSCTIAYWERGEHQPSQSSAKIIECFLTSFLPKSDSAQEFESFTQGKSLSKINLPNYIIYESR